MLAKSSSLINSKYEHTLMNLSFFLLVLITLILHARVFLDLNQSMIDSDQPYMWMGAVDYAKGLFYEPRYYAQDYNTFMEGLFAVPFLWLGLPVYYAVPLSTHIIFLFPFLFLSFYLFFYDKKVHALVVLSLVMCLPAEYDLLTSLPRGFVTGLFFTSFFIINILNPNSMKFIFLNTLFAIIGYFVNPNSVVVSMPFLFYIFLHQYKNPRYYRVTGFCLLLIWPCYLFFNQFYVNHPDYVMNGLHYNFSTSYFLESICSLDQRFAHLSFFFPNNCLVLLSALALLACLLYKVNKKAFASFWVFIAVILFSFCSGKTTEGSNWAFMSCSRMFLGIPLFICFFICLVDLKINHFYFLLLIIPLLFSTYKAINLNRLLAWHYDAKHFHGVRLFPLKDVMPVLDFYKTKCKENNTDFLLVSNRYWLNTIVCYGGPAVDPDFPYTQETQLEKRYWVRAKNNKKIHPTFIMVSSSRTIDELLPPHPAFELQKLDDYGLFLVKNNSLTTEDFIVLINKYESYD